MHTDTPLPRRLFVQSGRPFVGGTLWRGVRDEEEGEEGRLVPSQDIIKGEAGGGLSPGRGVGLCFFWRFGYVSVLFTFFGGEWGEGDSGLPF